MSNPSFEAEHRQSYADPEGGVRTARTKKEILGELNRLGIRDSTVFPEIDKAANFIKDFYVKFREGEMN
jgi:hypothetical protein